MHVYYLNNEIRRTGLANSYYKAKQPTRYIEQHLEQNTLAHKGRAKKKDLTRMMKSQIRLRHPPTPPTRGRTDEKRTD